MSCRCRDLKYPITKRTVSNFLKKENPATGKCQLYGLAVIDYQAAKLAPSGFLPKQKAYLESELRVMRKEMEVGDLENQLLIFAHFDN